MPRLSTSRRDFLHALLGAAPALAFAQACERTSQRPVVAGAVVGASAEFGHRAREAHQLQPSEWSQTAVAIVGGGVGGLSAGWRLKRAGFNDFSVFELEPEAGGTARGGHSPVARHPWGAHYINVPMPENRAVIALLDEMGVMEREGGAHVVAEQFLCREPEERLYYRGRWYEGLYLRAGASDADLAERARFDALIDGWVQFRDASGRRAFAIPMAKGSTDPRVTALDKLSMAQWLAEQGLRSPRLRWLVDYACRDDYGATAETTSAWAGLFYFAARKAAPGAESQDVVTWPEGNGRLAEHLHRCIKEHTQTGRAVVSVRSGDKGHEVVTLDRDGQAHGVRAKKVIFAAPQLLAPYLLRDRDAAESKQFDYGVWMVANLTLRDRPRGRGFPLAWDNVLYDSPSLGYVVATHQRGVERGPTVLTYYYPFTDARTLDARRKLYALDHAACAELALADLSRAHPDLLSLTERVEVMRWGHAMVRPSPGFVFGGARTAATEAWRGVEFAHSDGSGVALFEEAFFRGNLAAERTLAALGRPVESVL